MKGIKNLKQLLEKSDDYTAQSMLAAEYVSKMLDVRLIFSNLLKFIFDTYLSVTLRF